MKPAIRLSFQDECIHVQTIIPKRIDHHGFGSFLDNYDPSEIEITDEARAQLLRGQPRAGLQGMEFFGKHSCIAWASINPNFAVPINSINVEAGAVDAIRKFADIKIETLVTAKKKVKRK